jgi:putative ABC transport system permease protein
VRQLVGETLLLALAGGGLGLVVAQWGISLAVPFLGPRAEEAGLDGGVLAFTVGLSVLTGIATGLLPALRVTKSDSDQALLRGRTDSAAGPRAVRSALVATEAESSRSR